MQTGSVFKLHGAWHLRFRRNEMVNGKPVRQRVCVRLAPINDDYRSRKDLQPIIDRHLAPVNRGALPESGLTFAQFYSNHFLPHLEARNRKPSTIRFYRDTFKVHLRHRVGDVRLRDFSTATAQRVLDSINLSHQSLLRIKTCMSAAFTVARQLDFLRDANPIMGSKAEGKRSHFRGYAYTLAEISHMLQVLGEPARTAVAVAAFTGLREGEIRGLKWEDFDGDLLYVRRSVWRTHVGETKTEASEATVPVIAALKTILDAYRKRTKADGGYIFAGPKRGFALNLDNLTKREIRPVLAGKWHGWHAFRRGLTTTMFELGVPPEVSAIILRQEDAETTRRHYLILEQLRHGSHAMKQVETAVRRGKIGQQVANRKTKRRPRKSR